MATEIFTLEQVPENELIATIKKASDDDANIVTAINDQNGTFWVDSIFFDAQAGAPIVLEGKMSTFGGPEDTGVKPDEGLSLFERDDIDANGDLFLPAQPAGTTGLARRLNPDASYIACRWNTSITPKSFLKTLRTVKVTDLASGKSESARPADTGPAVSTGRIADLSPGLAKKLGLNTDALCRVEIPVPGGLQVATASEVEVNVNLAKIDATIFPADMKRKLVVMTTSDRTTYWIINQTGPDEGGQSLLKRKNGTTKILRSDTTVFPVVASDEIPELVAGELNKAKPKEASTNAVAGNAPRPGEDINAKMFAQAKAFVGHDTSTVPGTEQGNLACAWAVNEVTRLALGKPISQDGTKNGLSTAGMFDVLKAKHSRLGSANDAMPGAIIIAPTEGANHGHVGIVGQNGQVFSNRSVPGEFEQNFTLSSFTSRYTGKGLQVLFFALNANQFA